MAKNKKGKQKQDEPVTNNSQTQQSTVEQVNIPDDTLKVNNFAETQGDTTTVWGAPPNAGENWTAPDAEEWAAMEPLLQPPSTQLHNDLPAIHEQLISGNFARNRVLSEIEESPDEYDQSWHNSDSNSARHSESQTVTAAAPSFTGSPPTPPVPSNAELQEAIKAIATQGKSTASEAARKMEKAKAVQFHEPVIIAKVEQSNPQVAPHQGSSSASAAAAAAEFSRKKTQAPNPKQKTSISQTIPWTYPKELKPGARHPAPMPVDSSWISTGGNAWSNKHRNGFQNPSRSLGNEYLPTQYLQQPQFQQLQFQQPVQHAQQSRHPHHAQRPQAPHSHPAQPQTHHSQFIRPLHKIQTQQRQDWQDWGKEQRDQSTETESDHETVTATGWENSNQQEGDQWDRSRGGAWSQNQNATGGEWGQGVADGRAQNGWGTGEGRNQNAGGRPQKAGEGWGQHTAGGWDQGTGDTWGQSAGSWAQEPTKPKKDDRVRKSHPRKSGDEWGQEHETLGQKGQKQKQKQQRTEANGVWGQIGQESTQMQARDAWGQHTNTNHQGGQGGDTWGQGASTWDQHTSHRGNQGDDAWGQGASTWDQHTNYRGNQGGDAWDQGASTWDQDANHQSGQGGDAWGQGASTWGQDTDENRKLVGEWAAGASSNTAWGDEAQKLPKVTVAAPSEDVGSRNVLSAQQRSQILNLLNETQTQNVKAAHSAVKHGAQKKTEHDQWGAWEARDHGWGSEDEDDMDDTHTRRVRFSPKASELWGESPRSIPSKTLAQAQQGMTTTPVNDPNNVRFLESKGAAFEYVTNAFFGNSRLARERIHWLFPSDKDPRVAAMLAWVQKLSYNLGTFGLIKFLQHRERGGLFINAIFRMRHNPKEPALDWLTFNELQGTMDKTLQESVAFYDPSAQVMVFVYLPSESGNSIAIWRLKINVPDKTKSKYHVEVNAMVKTLRKHTEYIVCVDECPPKKKPVQKTTLLRRSSVKATKHDLPAQHKEKRKWWKIFFS